MMRGAVLVVLAGIVAGALTGCVERPRVEAWPLPGGGSVVCQTVAPSGEVECKTETPR